MATYKVLQDIEAEDKLLGPLTLKQFIFAAITIGIGYVEFILISSSLTIFIKLPFLLLFFLPMAVFGFLAAPISREQSNDIWLLARLRYLLKPHKRIWNQDGLSELVTVTAPKHVQTIFTKDLTQGEVKSRLQALANTVDSRGWAIKNINTNLFAEPDYLSEVASDRLVDPSSLPQEVPAAVVTAADDILDTENNSTAQHLTQMMEASVKAHRQEAIEQMRPEAPAEEPTNYWFMNQPASQAQTVPPDLTVFNHEQVVAPGTADVHPAAQPTVEEEILAEKIAERQHLQEIHSNPHMKTLQPLHTKDGAPAQPSVAASTTPVPAPAKTQTTTPNPAILELAHKDDWNVATIARQAQRLKEGDDEVVISLH